MDVFHPKQNWTPGTPLIITELFKEMLDMSLGVFFTKALGPSAGVFAAKTDGMIVAVAKSPEDVAPLLVSLVDEGGDILAGIFLWEGGDVNKPDTDHGVMTILVQDELHGARIKIPVQREEDGEPFLDMAGWVVAEIPSIADTIRPKYSLDSQPNLN